MCKCFRLCEVDHSSKTPAFGFEEPRITHHFFTIMSDYVRKCLLKQFARYEALVGRESSYHYYLLQSKNCSEYRLTETAHRMSPCKQYRMISHSLLLPFLLIAFHDPLIYRYGNQRSATTIRRSHDMTLLSLRLLPRRCTDPCSSSCTAPNLSLTFHQSVFE